MDDPRSKDPKTIPDPSAPLLQRLSQAAAKAAKRVQATEGLDSLPSAQSLRELAEKRLRGRALLLASNREPYVHQRSPDGIRCIRTAGGLTTALDAMAAACGSTWVCQGSGDADAETSDAQGRVRVPPKRPSYSLRRLFLSPEEDKGFYEGFSNETLWPLCHVAHVRPRFSLGDWQTYVDVNAKFAAALAEEAPPRAVVFLQDYHLALVGRQLKELRPDLSTALFWHIPWPSPEIFRICPWKRELLEGLLGNDLLGFHLPYHADNFLQTAALELECNMDRARQTVTRQGHATKVGAYPISIDFESIYTQAHGRDATESGARQLAELGLTGVKLGLGVDRLDYTKGIVERLAAVERLFELYPQWLERFSFLQVGVPSRSNLEDYRQVVDDIEARCQSINGRFGRPGWAPVVLQKGHFDFDTLVPFYKLADVCVVSSLHDGMNLVAKEFVAASSNDRGVLLLSPFTGAAAELEQALVVNPYDTEAMAEALHQALSMPAEEQKARLGLMRRKVSEQNIFRWAGSILSDVADLAEIADLGGGPQA
jgi:alpha,alpha-trehalose-phosphate synthase [UDP-forming]